jgi:hypothetical protein
MMSYRDLHSFSANQLHAAHNVFLHLYQLGEFLRKVWGKSAGGVLSEDMACDSKEAVSSLLKDKSTTSGLMAGVPKLAFPNILFCFVEEIGGAGFSS